MKYYANSYVPILVKTNKDEIITWKEHYKALKGGYGKELAKLFQRVDKYGNSAIVCAVNVKYPDLLELVKLDLPDQANPDCGSSWFSFIDPALCKASKTKENIESILFEYRNDLNKLSALLFNKDQWGRRPIDYMTASNLAFALTVLGFALSASELETKRLSSAQHFLHRSMVTEISSHLNQLKDTRCLEQWDLDMEASFSAEQRQRLLNFDKVVEVLPSAGADFIDNLLENIIDVIDPDYASDLTRPDSLNHAKSDDGKGRACLSGEEVAYYKQLNAARAKHLQDNRDKKNFSDALSAVFSKRCTYNKSIIQYAAGVESPYLKDLCMLDLPQPGNAYSGTSWLILVDPSKCKFSKTKQVIKNILAENSSDLRRFHALLFTRDMNSRCPIHYMHPQLIVYVAKLLNIQGAYTDSKRLQLITATIEERLELSFNSAKTVRKTSTELMFSASLSEIQQAIELKRQALDKTQLLIDRITEAFAKTNRTEEALFAFKDKYLPEIIEASEKNLIDQAMGEQLIDKIVNFSYSESVQLSTPSFFNRAAEKSALGKKVRFQDPDISSPAP
ncbi:hypothetical protein [Legionella sp. km772]|uniref:hypothetical protein n=1 Tax=Legionella sp. km772 TaxID=2498111 RepID=UPI000F8D47CD|nr:hypothetical protein [Legionella sp. km772]RUR07730.1 hypothetical protein ELY15_11855 [Legionella sp. km772]